MPSLNPLREAALRSLEARGIKRVVQRMGPYDTAMLVAGSGATRLVWFPAFGDFREQLRYGPCSAFRRAFLI
jgi:hypothetical protein